MSKRKTLGVKWDNQWFIINIEGNRDPDGILQPPLTVQLTESVRAIFKKITKNGNWLYEDA